jgi:hypothetical protein
VTPTTEAQAISECSARKLGPSACADLVSPFCKPDQGVQIALPEDGGVKCVTVAMTPEKAAALLKESLKNAAVANAAVQPATRLLVGMGLLAAGLIVWWALRD